MKCEMGKRRIFIAIKISAHLKGKILEWEKELLNRPSFSLDFTGKIRWLSWENLHITIIPPWYETDIELVVRDVRKIVGRLRPFQIHFSSVTYGPLPRHPRLIWAQGETPKELNSVKILLENLLKKQPEQHPFLLHLTLARFQTYDLSQIKMTQLDEKVSWQDEVGAIVLMESHLSPTGSSYEVLEEFKF